MKTKIIFTIDTEFSSHPQDIGIVGRLGKTDYGVPMLKALLDEYQFKATFFVDVYTVNKPFLKSLTDVSRNLISNGHNLELHTHPHGIFDQKRYGMKDYTLDEQIHIIKKGKDIFQEWFGLTPSAHRAGDWAADHNTFKALTASGIDTDSSMFYGWKRCALNAPRAVCQNIPVQKDGLLEIPASVFHCVSLKIFSPYRLVSTDGNSLSETISLIEAFQKNNIPAVNLVYHSFSFLRWNKNRTEYFPHHNRINKFKNLLKYISHNTNLEVKTIKDAAGEIRKNLSYAVKDFVPERNWTASLDRVMDRFKK